MRPTDLVPQAPASAVHADPARRRRSARPAGLSPRALGAIAALREDGIEAAALGERFPHVLNRLGESWDEPIRLLAHMNDLLVDRRGGRRGFPDDALTVILAIRRHAVRRIVVAAGLPTPRGAGLSPGRCTPSSPS